MIPPVSPAHSRRPIYSFAWAAGIVQRARASHVRGWEILDPLLGLSERQLAYLIACNDPVWPQIRGLARKAELWDFKQRKHGPNPLRWSRRDYEFLIRRDCKGFVKSFSEYLTSRLDAVH